MKSLLRQVKARRLTFRQASRPILVLGLRRGGSTMVAEAIWEADGVWYANEPCAVFPGRDGYQTRVEMLPPAEHSHFFALEGGELDKFAAYTRALLGAQLREMGTCKHTLWPLRADRVCLKVLNASWMLEWFLTETDALVLPLIRHPGAQAASVLRQGWDFPVRAYAKRPEALRSHFDDDQIDTIVRIADGPVSWDLAVLDWIVTSAPLRAAGQHGLRVWTYEEITRDRAAFARDVLIDGYGLTPAARIRNSFEKPSGSSRMSESETNRMISGGSTETLLKRWKSDVDDDMLKSGQALLDQFAVTHYSFIDRTGRDD